MNKINQNGYSLNCMLRKKNSPNKIKQSQIETKLSGRKINKQVRIFILTTKKCKKPLF